MSTVLCICSGHLHRNPATLPRPQLSANPIQPNPTSLLGGTSDLPDRQLFSQLIDSR